MGYVAFDFWCKSLLAMTRRTNCIRIFLSAHWKVGSKCMKHPQTDQFFAALSMRRNPPWFSFSEWATNFGPLMAGWLKAYPQQPQPEIDVGVWPFWSTKFGAAGPHEIAPLQNLPNYIPGLSLQKVCQFVSNSDNSELTQVVSTLASTDSSHFFTPSTSNFPRSLLPRGFEIQGPNPCCNVRRPGHHIWPQAGTWWWPGMTGDLLVRVKDCEIMEWSAYKLYTR